MGSRKTIARGGLFSCHDIKIKEVLVANNEYMGLVSDELMEQLDFIILFNVGRYYKKGWRWRAKLRWSMTKVWNESSKLDRGYPKEVRDVLGDDKALRLFQDRVDEIINSPELLEKAVRTWRKDNPLAEL